MEQQSNVANKKQFSVVDSNFTLSWIYLIIDSKFGWH
jgi:hypothetical protein